LDPEIKLYKVQNWMERCYFRKKYNYLTIDSTWGVDYIASLEELEDLGFGGSRIPDLR
jgi:hypothetical protein